jgi:hypothetical protein
MTVILRRTVGHVYVVIERDDAGNWSIEVSDAASGKVTDEEREAALQEVLKEMSKLRALVWGELKKS